jgi:HEPN domain-containing protein
MNEAELNHLRQWMAKAEHDLITAKLIIDNSPIVLDIACFHCQQAVEKYLKTFLIYHSIDFPRTHNLDLLLESCSTLDDSFTDLDLKNLEDFAVRGRYPHDFLLPELDETLEFYRIAEAVKDLVVSKIPLL